MGTRAMDSQFTAAGLKQRLELLEPEQQRDAITHFVNVFVALIGGGLATVFFTDKYVVKVVAGTMLAWHIFSV